MKAQQKSIILIGAFSETVSLCKECGYEIIGLVDPRPPQDSQLPYWGDDASAEPHINKYKDTPLVLSPDLGSVRLRLANHYRKIGCQFASLIHPAAYVSSSATVNEGVVIQNQAYVSDLCHLSEFSKLNVGAVLMHEVRVGEFTTIAPRAVVLGKVKVGSECYIGANSTVLPELCIGDKTQVGAGAVVTQNLPSFVTAKGVPAKYK